MIHAHTVSYITEQLFTVQTDTLALCRQKSIWSELNTEHHFYE